MYVCMDGWMDNILYLIREKSDKDFNILFHSTSHQQIRKIWQLLSVNKALVFSVFSCIENGAKENVSLSFPCLLWVTSISSIRHYISFCSPMLQILKTIFLRLKKLSNLASMLTGCWQKFWKNEEKKGLINLSLVIRNLTLQ